MGKCRGNFVLIVSLILMTFHDFASGEAPAMSIVMFIIGLMVIILCGLLYRWIKQEQNLMENGTLSEGTITRCRFVSRGSDDFDKFEIRYVFDQTESSLYMRLSEAAQDIVGKRVLVLHIDGNDSRIL